MKLISRLPRHRRIILYFALAIALPSIMMGALAYRGIQNDQALVERENRREALATSSVVFDYVNAQLKRIEKDAIAAMTSGSEIQFTPTFDELIQSSDVLYGAAISADDKVILPLSILQFLPDDLLRNEVRSVDDISPFTPGTRYEFGEEKHDKALAFYQRLLLDVQDTCMKANALNAIARLQKKVELYAEAITTYQVLITDYSRCRINRAIPLGLVGKMELAQLYWHQGDTSQSLVMLNRLQRSLIDREWKLTGATYNLSVSKSKEIRTAIGDPVAGNFTKSLMQYDSLVARREHLASRTNGILQFREGLVKSGLSRRTGSWIDVLDGTRCHVSQRTISDDTSCYTLVDLDRLLHQKLAPQLATISDQGSWTWSVHLDDYEVLGEVLEVTDDRDIIEMGFPAPLFDWKLVAYSKPLTVRETLLESNQGIYFFIFLFIGAVLIAGSSFLMYSINRELQLTRMKSDFIATVSHEFKSPLTSMRQVAEMLQRGRVPRDKREKYYNVLLQQGARLTHLIDNILDFSQIERGKKSYSLRECQMANIVERVTNRFSHRIAGDYQIELSIESGLPPIKADVEAIEQVLHNLLDNAVKYSGQSKVIEISTWGENGSVMTSIRDFGVGIPGSEQHKIFERFYRAGGVQQNLVKGSGIGLALVKEIVEAHGGTTSVVSEPGKGSIFSIGLPVSKN